MAVESISALKFEAAAHELTAPANHVDRGQQVIQSEMFVYVGFRSLTKSLMHDSGFDSIQFRQSDVDQDQFRLQFLRHLNCCHAVICLDDLKLRSLPKHRRND